ncbi:MAG: GspE/PulE family protein [Acidiferrobacterales bacterium]
MEARILTGARQQKVKEPEHRLTLAEVANALASEDMLSSEDAKAIVQSGASRDRVDVHPLVVIAGKNLKSARKPNKLLSLEVLTAWLAERAGIPYRRIDPLKIDIAAVAGVVSYAYALRQKILPVAVTADAVEFATCEPYLTSWIDELGRLLRKRIVPVLVNPIDIGRYLDEFYSIARSVARAASDSGAEQSSVISSLEQLMELGRQGQLDANDHHVVNIVDWLLQYAFEQRASDIHLEPRRDKSDIRFRIDGVLHPVYQVPTMVMNAIISRIKAVGRMDVAEKRRPQDGRLKTKTLDGEEVELRLSTIPTAIGEKMVMRIFDPSVLVRGFGELGFGSEDARSWQTLVQQPHGIVLVTGPTGSGKTTTLYSTLKQLATPEVNVCTVEDPIEMIEPSFNQMQMQHNIGLDFAGAVRAFLRQDPDIIMIGEIRDRETAEMAVQAALTGHLVLSTLHTNDAASAVTRLLEIGVPAYLIRATLLGVVAQRLVRTLCPHCKSPGPVDAGAWEALVRPWKAQPPLSVFVPTGCLECRRTGYLGRIGIYEMLNLTPGLRRMIGPETEIAALRAQGVREGMQPLRLDGAKKVHAGMTTIDEVMKVAPPPDDA